MQNIARIAVIGLSVGLMAGCANQLMSDERIQSETAMALGQPDSAIRIANRRYDGATNTSYTAYTPRGTYACMINGGTVLSLGMTNAAQCTPMR